MFWSRYKDYLKSSYFFVVGFTILYLIAFAIYFMVTGDTEFLLYVPLVFGLMVIVLLSLPITKLPVGMLWALSILELMHVAGGGIRVNGDVLYNLVLIPIINNGPNGVTIWRYDQLVHPYGSAIVAIVLYYLVAPRLRLNRWWVAFVVALAAMGVGSMNEVLEFITKLIIPHTDVGGYDNTALDLCSNFVGATIGSLTAILLWRKSPPREE